MQSLSYRLIFIAAAILLWALPARADIDQRCLNLCVANGDSGGNCLPKCTYNESSAKHSNAIPNAAAMAAPDPHNVFSAPKPAGDIMLPTHTAKQNAHSKDYVCINQCLQQGGQYDLCNKTCTRSDCPPGDGRCTDLRGNTQSALPSGNGSTGPVSNP